MLKKWHFCVIYCLIALTCFAKTSAPGNLFSLTKRPSNNVLSVATLCLNARTKPVSCQNYAFTGYSLTLKTTIPNHTYPYAGIKLDNSPYLIGVSNHGAQCQLQKNGFCIFPVNNKNSVTLQLVNPNQQLNFYPAQLSDARIGEPYRQLLIVTGGYPPYTWQTSFDTNVLQFETLPNTSISELKGVDAGGVIPLSAPVGSYPVSITVTDSQKNTATITQNYNLFINGKLRISPASEFLGNDLVNEPITPITLLVTNAAPNSVITYTQLNTINYPWPPGLTLTPTSSTTAEISGTPTQIGNYNFFVKAEDGNGNIGIVNYSVNIQPIILTLKPASGSTLPPSTIDVASNYYFLLADPSEAIAPVNYNSSSAPSEFSFSPITISTPPYETDLTGTTSTIGFYTMLITATDANNHQASGTYYLSVNGVIDISPLTSIASGQIDTLYSQKFTALNVSSSETLSWSANNIPAGLDIYTPSSTIINPDCLAIVQSLTSTQAVLCGTPTAVYNQPSNPFTVTVVDNMSSDSTGTIAYPSFTISGNAEFTPSSGTISATANTSITPYTVNVSNCNNQCSFTASSLPNGIIFASTGDSFTFSGTPTANATTQVSVSATGATLENTGTGIYTFDVTGITFSPSSATYTVPFRTSRQITISTSNLTGSLQSVKAVGASIPNAKYTISGNNVIMSFSYQSSYCPIGGCPTTTYNIQLQVTDSGGNTGYSGTYTIIYQGNSIN